MTARHSHPLIPSDPAELPTPAELGATVLVPSALAGFAGGRTQIHVDLPAEDPAQDRPRVPLTAVLDHLRLEVPALERRIRDERGAVRGHVNIYIDGVDIRELAGVGTVVVPGATIQIIAAVSGG